LNEAFVVSNNISDSHHLHKVYDGKDIKKWLAPNPEKWMIVFESKSTKELFGELAEPEAYSKMTSEFPHIFEHLKSYEDRAKKRHDKGDYWWELRNCAYYDLFDRPKIIFPNLQSSNKFSFDDKGVYLNAPAVFLPTDDLYLLGVLNSSIIWYFLKSICVVRSGGFIEVKPQYFEQIPIPELDLKIENDLSMSVNQILSLKKQNPEADTSTLEAEIDQLVYELYGLTEEEVRIVEKNG